MHVPPDYVFTYCAYNGDGWIYKQIPKKETVQAKVRLFTLFLCAFYGQ